MDESQLPPRNPTPEHSLFGNIRNWTDVFPWLRLVKVCRIVGGPVWIAHGLILAWLWQLGLAALGVGLFAWSLDPFSVTIHLDLFESLPALSWTSILAVPHWMAFGRVGALLAAGREIPSYAGTWALVFRRAWAGFLIAILPIACSVPFVLAIGASAKVAGTMGTWQPMATWLSMIVVLPAAVIAGVLLIGGKPAVALGLIGLMTAKDPDPMDSLSRGYEYTLRRVSQLFGYVLIAATIAVPVLAAWGGIAWMAWNVSGWIGATTDVLAFGLVSLLMAVTGMLSAAMIGGVYLLIRQSASGQEIDDVWAEPEGWIAPKLPSVQQANRDQANRDQADRDQANVQQASVEQANVQQASSKEAAAGSQVNA